MVVTPSGPPGHHVLIRVAVGKNLDHVLAQILLQCMEGMTAKSMERVQSLPHAWKDIVVVRCKTVIENTVLFHTGLILFFFKLTKVIVVPIFQWKFNAFF